MLKDLAHRNLTSQHLADARDHLHRQERMPSQRKEIVLPSDPLDPQHLLPDLGQGLLDLPLGSLVARSWHECIELGTHSLAIHTTCTQQRQLLLYYPPRWQQLWLGGLLQVREGGFEVQ